MRSRQKLSTRHLAEQNRCQCRFCLKTFRQYEQKIILSGLATVLFMAQYNALLG